MTGEHFGCKGSPLCTTLPEHGPMTFATAAEQHSHVHPDCHRHAPARIVRKGKGRYELCTCGAARIFSGQSDGPVRWTASGGEWVIFP